MASELLATRYRIGNWASGYLYYSVQRWRWWWPFWVNVPGGIDNMHWTVAAAVGYYERYVSRKPIPLPLTEAHPDGE